MDAKNRKRRRIALAVFVLYLVVLVYLLFFAEGFGRTIPFQTYSYNLVPFREIRRYVSHAKELGTISLINLAGNVLAFVPFGFFVPVLFERCRRFPIPVFLTAVFSLGVELVQLVTRVGTCDVDDIILNTLGGLIGSLLFRLFFKAAKHGKTKA